MMRRLRLSAACPAVAARTRITGFSLFTQETQRKHHVLQSSTLEEGKKNMQIMSGLWAEQTAHSRRLYNERARQRNALKINDPEKKNNTFNLLMRLFGEDKILLHAGDEAFVALLARSTMQAMTAKDTRRLRAKLRVSSKETSTSKKKPCTYTSAFNRFVNPHMALFDSFTEMQRSVAPTRPSAFAAVSKVVSLCNVTESGEESAIKNFSALSPEETHLFAPISDEEAPYFEVFCATRCGSLDYTHFNILQLFMSFRGIDAETRPDVARERLYRSLLGSDRSHDGAYFRARRCLERLKTLRSSDCGFFITKHTADAAAVPPAAYGIESTWDDVAVATMLAETRHAQSVYDDVLTRASMLRSAEMNARLKMYVVRPDEVAKELSVEQKSTERKMARNKVVRKVEELTAPTVEEEEEEVLAVQPAEKAAMTRKRAKAEAVAVAKPRSRSASPAKELRATKATATPVVAAKEKKKKKESPTAASAAARPKKAMVRHMAEMEEEEDGDTSTPEAEEAYNSDDEAPITTLRASTAGKTKSKKAAVDDAEDDYGAEEFLAGEGAVETEAEYDDDDVQAATGDSVEDEEESAEMAEMDAAAAAVRSATSTKRRTARSQLADVTSMLPAKARTDKLISKHGSARKKVQLMTKAQPSPYVPPGRNADFTASIRAMLSGSL